MIELQSHVDERERAAEVPLRAALLGETGHVMEHGREVVGTADYAHHAAAAYTEIEVDEAAGGGGAREERERGQEERRCQSRMRGPAGASAH